MTTPHDEAPAPRAPGRVLWAEPTRRDRLIAVALAVALAVLTFVVVNRVWRRAAPPPPAPRTSVEVMLVPSVAPAATATASTSTSTSKAAVPAR